MKTYEITLTSKNQITIPAEVVRSLKLSKNRVMELSVKEGKMFLTPEQGIQDALRPYWKLHQATKPVSVEDMNTALRSGMAHKANK